MRVLLGVVEAQVLNHAGPVLLRVPRIFLQAAEDRPRLRHAVPAALCCELPPAPMGREHVGLEFL
eukprot:6531790-Lingulodinium_polyedra.AAC.1